MNRRRESGRQSLAAIFRGRRRGQLINSCASLIATCVPRDFSGRIMSVSKTRRLTGDTSPTRLVSLHRPSDRLDRTFKVHISICVQRRFYRHIVPGQSRGLRRHTTLPDRPKSVLCVLLSHSNFRNRSWVHPRRYTIPKQVNGGCNRIILNFSENIVKHSLTCIYIL